MTQVNKYIKLYQEGKVTTADVKTKLSARKYKEWWDKLYALF